MPKQIERIYPLRKTTSRKLQRQKAEKAAIRERIEAFDAAMRGEAAVTVARKEKANRTALVCLVNKTLSDAWKRTSK